MGALADLTFLGAPVGDPVGTAQFINSMVLTRRQKAGNLLDYLRDRGLTLTPDIRRAASDFEEFL